MKQYDTMSARFPHSSCNTSSIRVAQAWMLDVDGVLVSLLSKQVQEHLIEILADRLQQGEPVTFNSGRSPLSIAQVILSLLEAQLSDKTLLERVMVVGEKGGGWAYYTPDGVLHVAFEAALAVPSPIKLAISTLVDDAAFRPLMEIEAGKRTMISVVKRRDVPLPLFQQAQAGFAALAQQYLAQLGFPLWKVDVVSDSTEIEHRNAGKGKGAQRIIHWLHYAQGIWPEHITVIEDSLSGIAMAEVLHQRQMPVSFVFTGPQHLPNYAYAFPIISTKKKYEQGAVEYFAQYQELSSRTRG